MLAIQQHLRRVQSEHDMQAAQGHSDEVDDPNEQNQEEDVQPHNNGETSVVDGTFPFGDQVVPEPLDAGAERGLAALRDSPPGAKPFYPYSTLIRYAIKGSPGQRLLLEDIYYAIEARFSYFRSAPSGWKNSVRHNLSLNPCFEKVPRPLTDRGKGSYWVVNDAIDPRTGVHRIRNKKKNKSALPPPEPTRQQQPEVDEQGEQPLGQEDGAPQGQVSTAAFPEGFDPSQQYRYSEAGPSTRMQYPQYAQYDPSGGAYPIVTPQPMRYTNQTMLPEVDENGEPNWHNIWVNELAKLHAATVEHGRSGGGDLGWYRMMTERVRAAFAHDVAYTHLQEHDHDGQTVEGLVHVA